MLRQVGAPLEIWDLELPPLSRGQVLVEIELSGICGTQLGEIAGTRGADPWLPHCLGHEAIGLVRQVGPDVTRVQPGDEVIASWIAAAGVPAGGAQYTHDGDVVNAGPITTLQRHAIIGETRLTRRPTALPDSVAVSMGCPAPTGVGSVTRVLKPKADDRVVVYGAGGVGLFAIAAARSLGVTDIVAVDPSAARRELARTWGASMCLDLDSHDQRNTLEELSSEGIDGCIVATGDPGILQASVSLIRPRGGRAVVIGNAPAETRIQIDPSLFNQGKSLLGTWGGDYNPDRDLAALTDVVGSYAELITDMYSTPYPLGLVNDAVAAMQSGTVGRALIDMPAGAI